jgi:hypothetical protein
MSVARWCFQFGNLPLAHSLPDSLVTIYLKPRAEYATVISWHLLGYAGVLCVSIHPITALSGPQLTFYLVY